MVIFGKGTRTGVHGTRARTQYTTDHTQPHLAVVVYQQKVIDNIMETKKRIRKIDNDALSPAVPLIKLLLVLLILLLLPDLVSSRSRGANNRKRKKRKVSKSFQNIKAECLGRCDPRNMAENQMCITACMNSSCHDKIYQGKELELGEIDEKREMAFEHCVKEFLRLEVARARQAVNTSNDGESL